MKAIEEQGFNHYWSCFLLYVISLPSLSSLYPPSLCLCMLLVEKAGVCGCACVWVCVCVIQVAESTSPSNRTLELLGSSRVNRLGIFQG